MITDTLQRPEAIQIQMMKLNKDEKRDHIEPYIMQKQHVAHFTQPFSRLAEGFVPNSGTSPEDKP